MSYKINKYPDGTSYVSIPEEWESSYQEVTFKVNNYTDLIHLAQLCDVLIFNGVKANITIPCLLDAQADKRFNEFHSSGLVVLVRVLESYVESEYIFFSVFHPHNPEVVEALFTSVEIIDNSEFIKQVLGNHITGTTIGHFNEPNQYFGGDNLILMSADAGGFKPLMKLCDKINWKGSTYSASKYRPPNGDSLMQFIDREDFEGKDILIVDDISVYGGTFKGLSKLLRERNCGKLYLAVSHMTVQELGEDPVTNYFDKVFTTNSKFENYVLKYANNLGYQPDNLKVIKMFEYENL